MLHMNSPSSSATFVTAPTVPNTSTCVPSLLLTSNIIRDAYFDFRDDVSTPPSSPPPEDPMLNGYDEAAMDDDWGLPSAVDEAWEDVDLDSKPLVKCLCDAPPALVITGQKFELMAKALAHYFNVRRAEGYARCVLIISRTEKSAAAWVEALDPILDEIKLTQLKTAKTKREAALGDLKNLKAPGIFVAHERLLHGDKAAIGMSTLRDAVRQNIHGTRLEFVLSDIPRADKLDEEHSPFRMLVDRQTELAVIAVLEGKSKSRQDITKHSVESYFEKYHERLSTKGLEIGRVWMTSKAIKNCVSMNAKDENEMVGDEKLKEENEEERNVSRELFKDEAEQPAAMEIDVLNNSDTINTTFETRPQRSKPDAKPKAETQNSRDNNDMTRAVAKTVNSRRSKSGERRKRSNGKKDEETRPFCPDPTMNAKKLVENLTGGNTRVHESEKRMERVLSKREYPAHPNINSHTNQSSRIGRLELETGQGTSSTAPRVEGSVKQIPNTSPHTSREARRGSSKETRRRARRRAVFREDLTKPLAKSTGPEPPQMHRMHWDEPEEFRTPPNSCENIPPAWEKKYAPTLTKPLSAAAQQSKTAKSGKERKSSADNRGSSKRSRSFHGIGVNKETRPSSSDLENRSLRKTVSEKDILKLRKLPGPIPRNAKTLQTSRETKQVSLSARKRLPSFKSNSDVLSSGNKKDMLRPSIPPKSSQGLLEEQAQEPAKRNRNSSEVRRKGPHNFSGSEVECVGEVRSSRSSDHTKSGDNTRRSSQSKRAERKTSDVIIISSDDEVDPVPTSTPTRNPESNNRANQGLNSFLSTILRHSDRHPSQSRHTGSSSKGTTSTPPSKRASRDKNERTGAPTTPTRSTPTKGRKITVSKPSEQKHMDSDKRRTYNSKIARAQKYERKGNYPKALQLYLECAELSSHDDAIHSRILALATSTGVLGKQDFAKRRSSASPIRKRRHRTAGRTVESRRPRSRKPAEEDVVDLTID